MRVRILLAGAVGVLVGVLGTLGSTVGAQQTLSRTPSVITPRGFIVEEVRVGGSCVVIVTRGGPPSEHMATTPCGN
jgi:hypothetical protein